MTRRLQKLIAGNDARLDEHGRMDITPDVIVEAIIDELSMGPFGAIH